MYYPTPEEFAHEIEWAENMIVRHEADLRRLRDGWGRCSNHILGEEYIKELHLTIHKIEESLATLSGLCVELNYTERVTGSSTDLLKIGNRHFIRWLCYLREFVEEMKASDFVAIRLDKSGQGDAAVAPSALVNKFDVQIQSVGFDRWARSMNSD